MRILPVCVFMGIFFITRGYSETIKCYVCDNCQVLDDSQLKTCPLPSESNSPNTEKPTTLLIESTISSIEDFFSTHGLTTSTTKSTDNGILPTKPTRRPTTDNPKSEATFTETSQKEVTTVKTEETQRPTEIYRPTTNEANQTTSPFPTETEMPTNSIPPQIVEIIRPFPNETEPSTSNYPEIESPPNGVQEILKPSLTESSEIQPEKTDPVEAGLPTIVGIPIFNQNVSQPTSAEIINPPTEAEIPSQLFKPEEDNSVGQGVGIGEPSEFDRPNQIFSRIPRDVSNSTPSSTYHCYSIDIIDGDAKKIKKGCIEVPQDRAACDVLKNEFGNSVDKCKICTEDKCNSGSILKYSIITLVLAVVLSFY